MEDDTLVKHKAKLAACNMSILELIFETLPKADRTRQVKHKATLVACNIFNVEVILQTLTLRVQHSKELFDDDLENVK
jgi:hypothetical protein